MTTAQYIKTGTITENVRQFQTEAIIVLLLFLKVFCVHYQIYKFSKLFFLMKNLILLAPPSSYLFIPSYLWKCSLFMCVYVCLFDCYAYLCQTASLPTPPCLVNCTELASLWENALFKSNYYY